MKRQCMCLLYFKETGLDPISYWTAFSKHVSWGCSDRPTMSCFLKTMAIHCPYEWNLKWCLLVLLSVYAVLYLTRLLPWIPKDPQEVVMHLTYFMPPQPFVPSKHASDYLYFITTTKCCCLCVCVFVFVCVSLYPLIIHLPIHPFPSRAVLLSVQSDSTSQK